MERVAGIEPAYSAWKAAALPLSYTRIRLPVKLTSLSVSQSHSLLSYFKHWWRGLDSNQRRLSQRIYSPPPLTTRAPLLFHRTCPTQISTSTAKINVQCLLQTKSQLSIDEIKFYQIKKKNKYVLLKIHYPIPTVFS